MCLGRLTANTAYATRILTPQLTYRVSTPGWFNYEDTPGNFLLVPPRNDLPGVNAGTSDFLGVYTAIVPARVVEPDGCVIEPVPGTWKSPVAAWFRGRPNLRASRPVAVSIGGLRGGAVDLRTKPGATLTNCRIGGQQFSSGRERRTCWSSPPPARAASSLARDRSTAPAQSTSRA